MTETLIEGLNEEKPTEKKRQFMGADVNNY